MNTTDSKAAEGFFIIPKSLIYGPEYSDLSVPALILFGLMLDRLSLSEKTGCRNQDGTPFIYFTVREICATLKCSKPVAVRLVKELESKRLISKERCGQGKPSKFYIPGAEEFKKFKHSDSKKLNSGSKKTEIQEVKKTEPNNTESNNTELINTFFCGSEEEDIRENIDYDCLIQTESKDEIDNIVSIISDVLHSTGKTVRVGSETKPREDVCRRLLSLNSEHIIYVLELLCTNRTQIRDIRGYLLKLLYYAPMTMDIYYSAKFASDRNGHPFIKK